MNKKKENSYKTSAILFAISFIALMALLLALGIYARMPNTFMP